MKVNAMNVIFLHIPKTAGQSVHAGLESLFGDAVCPARVNDQLKTYSISALRKYRIFSGHFDWSLLDCIPEPRTVFTVLRDPVERILSFYFYLKDKAEKMSEEELKQPNNQGLHAARYLSPDDYFCGGPPFLRRFLDDHYDNFYAYYFAGRTYRSRSEFQGLLTRGELSENDILKLALDNLQQLDRVFTLDRMDDVFSYLSGFAGRTKRGRKSRPEQYRVNVNSSLPPRNRLEKLAEYGASEKVNAKIEQWTVLDQQIWRHFKGA